MSNQLLIQIKNREDYEKVIRFMNENGITHQSDFVYDFLYDSEGVSALECYLEGNDLELPEDGLPQEMFDDIAGQLSQIFRNKGLLNEDRVFELTNQFVDNYLREKGFEID